MLAELQALRKNVLLEKERCSRGSGLPIVGSDGGPVGFLLIDAMIAVIEAQAKEIDALKAKAEQ
jgi:hypothetical protein